MGWKPTGWWAVALVLGVARCFALEAGAGPAAASDPATNAVTDAGAHAAALTMDTLDAEHKLSPGDRVSFRIKEDEEPAVLLPVSDAGELEVPYLGRVPVEGRTCRDVARDLKRLLDRSYYYDCTVLISPDLIVLKSRGRYTLSGAVGRPGTYDLPPKEAVTLSRAILNAGGFAQFANKKKVRIFRKTADATGVQAPIIVDVSEILDRGRTEKDVELQPDDMIVVSERVVNF